jgi:hypothetical protein
MKYGRVKSVDFLYCERLGLEQHVCRFRHCHDS